MPHIPFAFTLLDKRHAPFVEGKRRGLLAPIHCFLSQGFITGIFLGSLGLYFLLMGLGGLIRGFFVRNDWITTEATIVTVLPVQSGDHFNWHYIYQFEMENGGRGTGKIVHEKGGAFSKGQRVTVRYLSTDPTENVYAHDPMPKSVLYWFLIGVGSWWGYIGVNPVIRHIAQYRTMHIISRRGQAAPGTITKVHPPPHPGYTEVKFEFTFTSPEGKPLEGHDTIPKVYLTANPEPGIAVAMWYAPEDQVVVL